LLAKNFTRKLRAPARISEGRKQRTYEEAYKEVKRSRSASPSEWCSCSDQSEARNTLLQARLEKKVRSQQEYIQALTDEYGRVEDECRRLRDNARDLLLAQERHRELRQQVERAVEELRKVSQKAREMKEKAIILRNEGLRGPMGSS
jgi:predicted nuclease with TOPRIM domain